MSHVRDRATSAPHAGRAEAACPLPRRRLLKGGAALGAAALALPRYAFAASEKQGRLAGKSIHMQILGVAGWLPSELGVGMSPDFARYAKDKYGYEVSFSFASAPFGTLFQKAATSLATRSQEYNIIISDSQWLGALATPHWIVQLNDIIAKNPELNIEWWSPTIRSSYQVFPDGSNKLWGFPQVGDCYGIFIRKDILEGPGEADAFKAKYGRPLPTTWEDFEKMDYAQWTDLIAFFNRPEKGYYGLAAQYSREYDAASCPTMSVMRSLGGDVWDPKTGQVQGILDTASNAHAMELYKAWLKYQPPGVTNYFIAEVIDAFTQGKVFAGWQWMATGRTMIPEKFKDKVLVVPPPGFKKADGTLDRNYIIGGQPWVINAFNDAEHMQVAIDFMKWWYLPETSHEYLMKGGMPCDKATCARPDFDSINPWNRTYKYMLLRSSDFWHDPKYSEMLSDQQDAFTGYYTGQIKDPLHALQWTACQQQKILYDEGTATKAPTGACRGIRL
ncbi:MAG: ABC transporter substrate-binding protein [Acetobacteraceae bacterium]